MIAFGALILLNKVGVHLGPFVGAIMGYAIPIIMIGLGYVGIKNGSKFGWIVAALGVVILLGKLAGWMVILLAVGLIVYGITLLTGRSRA
ncbi:hypothetical protein D3C73_1353000 [compost metagenome]